MPEALLNVKVAELERTLTTTAVKTGAYTAAAQELVRVDATAANRTITLPTQPADKTRVCVKVVAIGAGKTVTVQRGGTTDVFNVTGGATSISLAALDQSVLLQYDVFAHLWIVVVVSADITSKMDKTLNLSDVADTGTARSNLRVPALLPVQVVATANVASRSGLPTTDGVTLQAGDQILLVAQTTASQNGPWVVAAGAWTRPTDFPSGAVVKSRTIRVVGGTVGAGKDYTLTVGPGASVTVDTTSQVWTALSAESSVGTVLRDAQGRVESFGSTTILTRDSLGRVLTYSDGATTYAVTYDDQGVLEVATA